MLIYIHCGYENSKIQIVKTVTRQHTAVHKFQGEKNKERWRDNLNVKMDVKDVSVCGHNVWALSGF